MGSAHAEQLEEALTALRSALGETLTPEEAAALAAKTEQAKASKEPVEAAAAAATATAATAAAAAAAAAATATAAATAASPTTLSVAQACAFFADTSVAGVPTAEKKSFLAQKGASAFVIAQAECVAPEDNVQGHPGGDEGTGRSAAAAAAPAATAPPPVSGEPGEALSAEERAKEMRKKLGLIW